MDSKKLDEMAKLMGIAIESGPDEKEEGKQDESEWTCRECTFVNESRFTDCQMCLSAKKETKGKGPQKGEEFPEPGSAPSITDPGQGEGVFH